MPENGFENLREKVTRLAIMSGGSTGLALKKLETGQTLFLNEDLAFPAASLIKIPIIVAIAILADRGRLKLSDTVVVEPDTLEIVKQREQDGSGILARLRSEHQFTVEELCVLAIIVSDNVAANRLLSIAGIDSINGILSELGLSVTRVTNRLEDFEELDNPLKNPTTPYEILCLLEMLYLERIPFSREMIAILKQQQLNSRLPLFLPSELKIAHKTGSLDRSFHDAGIIYTPRGNYILAVLTGNMTSKATGELMIAEMSRIVYEALR
jgi:beta-lactamase class A